MHTGISQAIVQAFKKRSTTKITFKRSKLFAGAKNRSIEAFLANPANERQEIGQNTDPTFDQLMFYNENNQAKGVFNWFAAHATSMKKTNKQISGDNKGYAAYAMEKYFSRQNPSFVAAFGNSNGGDASPNIAGDVDGNGSWDCKLNDNKACAKLIGNMQYQKAKSILESPAKKLEATINAKHLFVDFSKIDVDGAQTCKAAVGKSMLAGSAEDGSGIGQEGSNCSNGFGILNLRGCGPRFDCHGEKPVVVVSGARGWHPNVYPYSLCN